ncbi:17949_t:CDS:2 [Acaulospora morrowiae]|uniref:17949_t:CDS:1 n=1 Tax=Acaulospora morrowiae TaxID=94023 RepID=A0A9N9FGJ3_9GLOM|nr:17949_t:CDS:2 [Acaulospora morrowiae]
MDSFTNPSLEKDIAFDLATQPALPKIHAKVTPFCISTYGMVRCEQSTIDLIFGMDLTNCGAENVHTTREQKKAIPCNRRNVPPLMTLIVHGSFHLCTYRLYNSTRNMQSLQSILSGLLSSAFRAKYFGHSFICNWRVTGTQVEGPMYD